MSQSGDLLTKEIGLSNCTSTSDVTYRRKFVILSLIEIFHKGDNKC